MTENVVPGLVSIVVASYNHAEYLAQRMDSLIAQTYQQIEIIVIDDCSTDDSLQVLRSYENAPRVKLLAGERNGGWIAVSNQGIELSRGEFLLFANCDDACEPQLIERLVSAMRSGDNVGIAFCRSWLIDKDNKILSDDLRSQQRAFQKRCAVDALIPGAEMGKYLLHSCVIPNLSAALIRRECFSKVGFLSPDYRACSDWDLFFRVAEYFDFSYVSQPLNHFRQHETTIRSVMKERATYEEYFRVLLGNLQKLRLSLAERTQARMRVMSLWAVHLVSPTMRGVLNFPYHFGCVLSRDPVSLIFLVPSVVQRVISVFAKLIVGRRNN